MRAKRIKLFVDGHFFDKKGSHGVQTFLRELYTQLLADHPELDIYFGTRNVENIKNIFPGLPSSNILPYKKRSRGVLRFIFDIPAYIKKYQFDFAHFQYITPHLIQGCRYIVTLHDVLFNDFKKDFTLFFRISRHLLFGRSIIQAQIKTTVSDYSKQRICSHYNIPANEIHVIQNGANDVFKQSFHSKQEAVDIIEKKFGIKNFILYISRVEPRKNQLLLLKKYLTLHLYKRGIALVFIGKESINTPALTRLIANLNDEQQQSFYWLRHTDQADLMTFYSACRLFVYPSRAEGFGIPPLEAAVCHAPVLCSSATAMQDFSFFEPYTFDPENEQEFEQKLLLMIDTPPPDIFINGIAEHVKQHYNWKQSSHSFYNLLQVNN